MTEDHRITRLATLLRRLCDTTLVALPLGIGAALLTGTLSEATLRAHYAHHVLPDRFTNLQWLGFLGLGAVGLGLVLWLVFRMRQLFDLYTQGDILGRAPARAVLRLGQGLLVLEGFRFVAGPLTVLILTLANPPGQRALAIAFGSADLFLFFAAGLLTVIGWVLTRAADIAEDNAGFV